MKKCVYLCLMGFAVMIATQNCSFAQSQSGMASEMFPVSVEEPENGSIQISPAIPENGQVSAGTALTVEASPARGYALDAIYYYNPGAEGWRVYHESMQPETEITVDQEKVIGASFIEEEALEGFSVIHNVEYAQPGVKKLKYDVYSPDGAENLPIVVIVHGGGWRANTEDIMRGLAREIVRTGDYVVASIDYRFIGTGDGDEEPNVMADLIEDVYGAVAHIQEHAEEYGGDPTRIAITGDSAGGHLSAAAANMTDMIGDGGFGVEEGVFEYEPTYMPADKTVDQVREEISSAIQVAAPSYGVFGVERLARFAGDNPESWAVAIAPIAQIPDASERVVPQLLLRGMNDGLIQDAGVSAYADSLAEQGHPAEYVQIGGVGHAFFDWKPDARTKATFFEYGVPYAQTMIIFFNREFYPSR